MTNTPLREELRGQVERLRVYRGGCGAQRGCGAWGEPLTQEAADAIEQLLAEPGGVPAVPVGWRSMDDAPKDGSLILIFRATRFSEERYAVVRWDEDFWQVHDGKNDWMLRGPDPTRWLALTASLDPLPEQPSIPEGVVAVEQSDRDAVAAKMDPRIQDEICGGEWDDSPEVQSIARNRITRGPRPKPSEQPGVRIDDAMVQRAARAIGNTLHGCGKFNAPSGDPWTDGPSLLAARAALKAALGSTNA